MTLRFYFERLAVPRAESVCSDAFHVPPSPIPLVRVEAVALDQFGVFLAHLCNPLVARVLGQDGRRRNVTVRRIALHGGGVVHIEPTIGRFLVPRKGFEIVAIDQEVDRRRWGGRGQLSEDVADAGSTVERGVAIILKKHDNDDIQ